MYKVIVPFADSCDDGYVYRTGDTYPREGYEPTSERVAELIGTANGRGFPVIEPAKDPVEEPIEEQAEEPVEEVAVETAVEETAPKPKGRPRRAKK